MSNTNTGGPAFPAVIPLVHSEQQGKDYLDYSEAGMTLRDYFAAKAIPGLMARNWSNHKGTDEELIGVWARSSYAVADAMLKAREA
jgi:hypothetical protein